MSSIGQVKAFSSSEFARILINNGFEYVGKGKGSHKKFKRENNTVIISRDLSKMISRRIIKDYNLKI